MHLIDQNLGFMGRTAIVVNSMPIGTGLGLSIKLDYIIDTVAGYYGH